MGRSEAIPERRGVCTCLSHDEADQLVRILTAIAVNTKRRMLAGLAVSAFCILNSALLFS
jgi:hypothetical protein